MYMTQVLRMWLVFPWLPHSLDVSLIYNNFAGTLNCVDCAASAQAELIPRDDTRLG